MSNKEVRYFLPIKIPCSLLSIRTVRMEGLEPPYLTASDPKSDVSTNFTTSGLANLRELSSELRPARPVTHHFIAQSFVWGCKCRAFIQTKKAGKTTYLSPRVDTEHLIPE